MKNAGPSHEKGRISGNTKTIYVILMRCLKLVNVAAMAFLFSLAWYMFYKNELVVTYYWRANLLIILLFVILYIVFVRVYDAFLISLTSLSEIVLSQSFALLLSDGIMYIVIIILCKRFPNILPLLLSFAAQVLISLLWSAAVRIWYARVVPPVPSLLVLDKPADSAGRDLRFDPGKEFNIVRTVYAEDVVSGRSPIGDDIKAVFVYNIRSEYRDRILKECVRFGLAIYTMPDIVDTMMIGSRAVHILHLPIRLTGRYDPPFEYHLIKRLFDVAASALALLILSPLFAIVSIAIKTGDHGPVFFRQKRLTKDGRIFDIIKFRSMRVNAEADGIARLSTGDNDDRITKVGRFIRKCRIDELPQLINILKNDMSFVGPRPERPEIAQQYEKTLPDFSLRLQVKAGLTGYAQVYGKYNTSPYEKLVMDMMYISNPRLLEDIRIILITLKVLFMRESTEGVGDGQLTAEASDDLDRPA